MIDEYKSLGTEWMALYVNGKNETYFDSLGVKQSSKKLKNS